MNYSELKTAVLGYTHRQSLAPDVPTFIANAESSMFRELEIDDTEVSASVVSASSLIALPAGCGRVTRVTVNYGGSEIAVEFFKPNRDDPQSSPIPFSYSREGTNLRLHDGADGTTFKIYYIPDLTPLSDTVQTNWLLSNASDLYQYAACVEAARFVRNYTEVDRLQALIPALIESVRSKVQRKTLPKGGMRIRVAR